MENYDVVSVGAATLDIFIRSDKFRVVKDSAVQGGVAICEVYGGKTEVQDVNILSGGGATNTAVSFARKELRTACIAEMGNDPAALVVHKELEEAGVDTRFLVQEEDETTAVSVILITQDGGRSVIVYRGAAAMLQRRDIPFEQLKTRWVHISSLGGNLKLLEQILLWAKKGGVRVSLNPGMTEIAKRSELVKLLPFVEMLFVNREECEELFELKYTEAEKIPGAYLTVVTDGARGGAMYRGERRVVFEAKKPKKLIDATGAGDAFASGMISGVLYGMEYERAIEWGLRNAVGVVEEIGAKGGLLTLPEVK